MTPQPSETTLVIAGAWNPAILTPEWVIRNGLELPQDQGPVRVQAAVPAGMGLTLDFPRFTVDGVTFTARPDAFVLSPHADDEQSLGRIERVARNTLTQLTHTPIGGYGQNFEFRDDAPDADMLTVFTQADMSLSRHAPEAWQSERSVLHTTYRDGDLLINITRQYSASTNQLTFKFNFHHAAASAAACAAMLSGEQGTRSMYQNYQLATQLVHDLFGDVANENQPEVAA